MIKQRRTEGNNKIRFYAKVTGAVSVVGNTLKSGYPYFGDRTALLEAFPNADKKVLQKYQQDAICGTWEMLADALVKGGSAGLKKQGFQKAGEFKHECANRIGPLMDVTRNQSPSFENTRQSFEGLLAAN